MRNYYYHGETSGDANSDLKITCSLAHLHLSNSNRMVKRISDE